MTMSEFLTESASVSIFDMGAGAIVVALLYLLARLGSWTIKSPW